MEKTNVMRLLDKAEISYKPHFYDNSLTDGEKIAEVLKEDPYSVFKTLVTVGKSNQHYVFMIPVEKELNLKKAAKVVNEKSVEMVKSKDLLALTGYIHGGCSPIGMKKLFTTVIHNTAELCETIIFTGGKIGYQVEMKLEDLKKIMSIKMEDIVES